LVKNAVKDDFPAGTTVVAVATVKVGVSYTFPDGIAVTPLECKNVVVIAYDVHEDNVNVTQAAATTRRLGERRLADSRMDVVISYDEANQAQAAAALETSNSTAGQEAFSVALAAEVDGIDVAAARGVAGSVTAPTVEVEIVFSVTGDAEITPPTAVAMQTIMSTNGATVTAHVSAPAVAYTFMPCSAKPTLCTAGHTMRPSPESIGCAGADCVAADHDTCCLEQPSGQAGDARRACVLGSLTVLALSGNFLFA